MFGFILLGDEWRDVWLKTSYSDAEDDQADGKGSDSTVGVGDDGWDSGNDKNDVTNYGDAYGDLNSLETAPILVGHVGSQQRHNISPHGVEGCQASRCSLTKTQCAGLSMSARRASGRAVR